MDQVKLHPYIQTEAKVWLNRPDGTSEVLRIVPALTIPGHQCYMLYPAYENQVENMGRILFDAKGYWIYDGDVFGVKEQEQLAAFITRYVEKL